jgi:hypothetical protein
MTGFDV